MSKALAKEPGDRYPQARDFLRALLSYIAQAGLMASSLRFGQWLRDHFEAEILERRRQREGALSQSPSSGPEGERPEAIPSGNHESGSSEKPDLGEEPDAQAREEDEGKAAGSPAPKAIDDLERQRVLLSAMKEERRREEEEAKKKKPFPWIWLVVGISALLILASMLVGHTL